MTSAARKFAAAVLLVLVRLRYLLAAKQAIAALYAFTYALRLHPRYWRRDFEIARNIQYAGTRNRLQRLDVLRPKGMHPDEKRPLILYFPGGGFIGLGKGSHRTIAREYVRQGYVVAIASYRHAPKDPFPAAHEDAASAFRWVLKNATRYGGDTERLIVAGDSAGGNLAVGMSIACCWKRPERWAREVFATSVIPRSVLVGGGFLQVSDPERRRPKGKMSFMMSTYRALKHLYLETAALGSKDEMAMADPLFVLQRSSRPASGRKLPAFFIGSGSWDPVRSDSAELHGVLTGQNLGADARFHQQRGGHVYWAIPGKKSRRFYQATFSFLAERGVDPTPALGEAGRGSALPR